MWFAFTFILLFLAKAQTVASYKFHRKICAGLLGVCIQSHGLLPVIAFDDSAGMMRFQKAYDELVALDRDWDSIVAKGDPDNIRRRLGTVYSPPKCEPALCGFQSFYTKFAQSHPDDLDIVELEEPVTQFLQAINQADFLAYSAIFSEYGNGGGGKDYVADSHKQVKKSISLLREVIDNIQKQ